MMGMAKNAAVRLRERFARHEFCAGVMGLGAVGAVTAEVISGAHVPVVGYDRSAERLAEVGSRLRGAGCSLASRPEGLAEADVIVVAVHAGTQWDGHPGFEPVRSALSSIGAMTRKERLVILETTVPPGSTRRLAAEFFPPPLDEWTLLAHCPERFRVGEGPQQIRMVPRLVGGIGADARAAACSFFEAVDIRAVEVSEPEVAELAKLLENAFLTAGISLMADITRISHALGIEAREVALAASTKPHGYFPFMPGPGIGGHCLLNDLRLLHRIAEDLGIDAALLAGIEASAARMPDTTVARLEQVMRMNGVPLENSHVCVVGVGFKPGCPDTTWTPAVEIVRLLRARAVQVTYCDSQVPSFSVDGTPVSAVSAQDIPADCAAVLILSGDRRIALSDLGAPGRTVLDAGGAGIMKGELKTMERL